MANAIYYNELYLLLPEEYPDFESFQAYLHSCQLPADVKMVVLREDHKVPYWTVNKGRSIAPYFLTGFHDEPSRVRFLNTEEIYPVQVELMDQDTYNARLREVINAFCPGCKRFKPLTARVQSLNGHHEEIALNSVCFYRYEENPSPRVFREMLFSFGGFFIRSNYAALTAEEMKERLTWNYMRFNACTLDEKDGEKYLTLECKKGEVITPILTQFVAGYVENEVDEHYHILLRNPVECSEEYLLSMLREDKQEAFQKECKKYGVSIGILEYQPDKGDAVRRSLTELTGHYCMEPLISLPGKTYYLITDTSHVLKELHYRTPVLEAYNTTLALYTRKERRKYKITFDMPSEIL